MKRSADESQISVLLKDFEDADILLAKVRSIPQRPLQSTLPISMLDPSLNGGHTDYRRNESMARLMVLDSQLSTSIGQ
jgi:hypothetical protein